jgi:hypothetical protein
VGRAGNQQSLDPEIHLPRRLLPILSEVTRAIEHSRLLTTDVEVLPLHYAETLRHWGRRFAANRDTIASLYDERFCRMFEFYLSNCELAFRHASLTVFQIQLTHRQAAVPLTGHQHLILVVGNEHCARRHRQLRSHPLDHSSAEQRAHDLPGGGDRQGRRIHQPIRPG